jgi:hypothetical protein
MPGRRETPRWRPTKSPFEPPDPGRINPVDPVELASWCRELGGTEARLREALAAVGGHVAEAQAWLAPRR